MEMPLILLLALLLDLAFGEPPNALHPVAWMGKVATGLSKGYRRFSSNGQFIYGAALTLFIMALFAIPVYFLLAYLKDWNTIIYVVVGAVIFKTTFSLKGLRRAALVVKRLVMADKMDAARRELRALVSRDTENLSREGVVSAAVESVAENAGDSMVAPLFYFLLLGVPGAVAYRVVNTLDAMFGYHGQYEYLGKFAARLDDVLNFIPARLAALLLVLAAFIWRCHGRNAWRMARLEHTVTESPNAGWPMAAVAGALDVQLEKSGAYKLGHAGVPLAPLAIDDSLKLVQTALIIWVLVCIATGSIRYAFGA